jgi:hypothetical protein
MARTAPVPLLCTSDVTVNCDIQGPYRSTAVGISSVVTAYRNVVVCRFSSRLTTHLSYILFEIVIRRVCGCLGILIA